MAVNAYGHNNYDILAVNITTTQTITFTDFKPVYIRGVLGGTTFTPIGNAPLTQTANAEGAFYILLGVGSKTRLRKTWFQEL